MGQIRSYTKISGASRWSTNRSGTTAVDYMLKSIGRHPLLIADQEIVGAGIWLIFSVLANMNARTEEIIVVAKEITNAVE